VEGSIAYIADGEGGLLIMDVSDPAHPFTLSRLRTARRAQGLRLDGDLAYVADSQPNSGVQVFDVSDPCEPFVVGFCPVRYACDIEIVNGHALVAAYHEPLSIVPLDCVAAAAPCRGIDAAESVRLSFSANPCFGEVSMVVTVPRAGDLLVTLHDVQGRLVREVYRGSLTSGVHRLQWDGCTQREHRAPTGTYFACVSGGGSIISRRLVLIR